MSHVTLSSYAVKKATEKAIIRIEKFRKERDIKIRNRERRERIKICRFISKITFGLIKIKLFSHKDADLILRSYNSLNRYALAYPSYMFYYVEKEELFEGIIKACNLSNEITLDIETVSYLFKEGE